MTRPKKRGEGRPCPFCGGRRLRLWNTSTTCYVSCRQCGAEGPFVETSYDAAEDAGNAEAIALWNWRKGSKDA